MWTGNFASTHFSRSNLLSIWERVLLHAKFAFCIERKTMQLTESYSQRYKNEAFSNLFPRPRSFCEWNPRQMKLFASSACENLHLRLVKICIFVYVNGYPAIELLLLNAKSEKKTFLSTLSIIHIDMNAFPL